MQSDPGSDADSEPGDAGRGDVELDGPELGAPTSTVDAPTLTGRVFHLHPLSIPYRLFRRGLGILFAVLFAGVPIFTTLIQTVGRPAAVLLVVGVAAAGLGYAVAYYRRFEYGLTADTFDIRSGVFSRREREIPLRRIQNVDISQNVVQRALGLAEISLETAGGSTTEARLRFVGEERATHIQGEVSRLSRSGEADADGAGVESDRFETVFEITDRELGALALVSMDLRLASLVFLGASLFAPSAVSMVDPGVVIAPEVVVGAVLGPLAGLALVVFFGLLSGVVNATRYYGFRLHRAEEELRYERGLLQQFSGTIPLGKVQSLTIRENVLARALGYAALYIETAGQGGNSAGDASQSAIPLAERERVHDLATSIEDYGDVAFQRPPRRARERYAARYAIVLLAVAGVAYALRGVVPVRIYWQVPLAALLLVPVAAHLKWAHRGYYLGENHVLTRNGFWVRRLKVVPYRRVQTVFSTETVFQRRRRLCTVTVDTAGSRSLSGDDARAVDVATETAEDTRERVADRLYRALRRRRRKGGRSETTGDRRPDAGAPAGDWRGSP